MYEFSQSFLVESSIFDKSALKHHINEFPVLFYNKLEWYEGKHGAGTERIPGPVL